MDSIHITGIRSYGYTGYLPEEQMLGQWFEVDVTLWLDLTPAGTSDQIADTLDYRHTITTVETIIKTCKFALIERLATEITDTLLKQPLVKKVRIQLTKPNPPIPDFTGKIQIDLTREST
ncbi:dihydroneopterin aldolase [Planktothrix pseudagardhii]|uniref:7,8-dihydroneopterin aldolase n=1 Tax=Planktothrix pseudagardhii TaxID=132604 RepID=A0A9W4G8W6_9CYAN|nr:dihydroneopterin aldolase [Planktothrix pseudagardhii]CAD5970292.1 putative dihydroneopterin aldolase [Planktothrix pseudagardhii]